MEKLQWVLEQCDLRQCDFSITRLTFWSKNIRFFSEINEIPRNSMSCFCLHTSIDSNNTVSNSAMYFLDTNANACYLRTYCIYFFCFDDIYGDFFSKKILFARTLHLSTQSLYDYGKKVEDLTMSLTHNFWQDCANILPIFCQSLQVSLKFSALRSFLGFCSSTEFKKKVVINLIQLDY